MKKNIVPIAFAFDNNLVMPACICISSLLMNARPDTFYDIFILQPKDEELNKAELNKIPSYFANCKLNYRKVENIFDNAFQIRGINTVTYYRLLIPQLIPEYNIFKFRKYSNNVIKKAKEFDNSMIITILMSPNKRYSTL